MILILAYTLSTLPRFDSGPGVVLNLIGFHPVILEGEVLAVEPRPASYDTFLILRARSYLHGSGPDTVRIELNWINNEVMCTEVNGRMLPVPVVGDQGIFWIGRQAMELAMIPARLTCDCQIWEIENDSLQVLRLSLDEGRRLIRQAASEASLAAQLPLASNVVVGRLVHSTELPQPPRQPCDDVRPVEGTCFQLLAEEVLKGPPLPDTLITVVAPSRNAKTWQQGVYLLTRSDSLGRFRPIHPDWSYFPAADGKYVVGFQLVSREPVDCLVPILADRDELLDIK